MNQLTPSWDYMWILVECGGVEEGDETGGGGGQNKRERMRRSQMKESTNQSASMWWREVAEQGEKMMMVERWRTNGSAENGATCRRGRDTHFFCSFLFLSAGPPRVPTPRPSLGEFSASGVPAENRGAAVRSGGSSKCCCFVVVFFFLNQA